VLAGAPERASVVAQSPMRLLRLPADVHARYLRELPDVEAELQRLAARPRSRVAANTAEAMAALRATGAAARDPALRNPDHMARDFLTAQLRVHALAKLPGVRRALPALAERLAPGGLHYETARVKHIDAILRRELGAGLDQLVILGAGYDSRPYRFAAALRGVRVYEIDLPPISAIKRRKVQRVLGAPPRYVTYVEADFRGDDLRSRLQAHGYDLGGATLLILSGVAPYLPEPAVARLFAFAGDHTSPRSSIAFDYVVREMVEGDDAFHGAPQVRRRLAALGEPLRFGIPAGGARGFLAPFGLSLASDLRADELADRYLRRSDGTLGGRPYGFAAIAHARVAVA
jgi:methyltransferase (TIGR00027 family)